MGLRPARVPVATVVWRGVDVTACVAGLKAALVSDATAVLAAATAVDAVVVGTGRPKFGAPTVRDSNTYHRAASQLLPVTLKSLRRCCA